MTTEQYPQNYIFKLWGKSVLGYQEINGKLIKDPQFCFHFLTKQEAMNKYNQIWKVCHELNILQKE